MANFAKIRVSDDKVMHVIVVSDQEVDFNGDTRGETWCQTTFKTDPSEYYWKQTSYNTGFGVHYNSDGEPSEDQSKAFRKTLQVEVCTTTQKKIVSTIQNSNRYERLGLG